MGRDQAEPLTIGWIQDYATYTGGAELTCEHFLADKPDHVTIRPAAPDDLPADCDLYVLQNITQFGPDLIDLLAGKSTLKYVHDLWPHGDPTLRRWVMDKAQCVFTTRKHLNWFAAEWGAPTSPPLILTPPVNHEALKEAASPDRSGTVWLGRMYEGKGLNEAIRWASGSNIQVDFYGDGPDVRFLQSAPPNCQYRGALNPSEVPYALGRYQRYLFIPNWPEPCGRTVLEAWASGCELILNDNVGAKEITESGLTPTDALTGLADNFWGIVTRWATELS